LTTPLAIQLNHALQASRLPFHHREPFDRLLVAQAGVFKAEVDTYSSSQKSKVILFEIGSLPPGRHSITIEVTGRKNTAAASAWVWVDAFDYR